MHRILRTLSARLDGDTRATIGGRISGLMRGVKYEAERQSHNYTDALAAGWTINRIEIICCLNAFYQTVLGPLAAATRSNLRVGLIRDIPINYGEKVRVTNADASLIRECHNQFTLLTQQLGIDFWCLQSAHAQDLLYKLAHPRQNHE